MKLIPWQPIEIEGIEYQPAKDPDEGILSIGNIRFAVRPFSFFKGRPLIIEIENVFYDSRDMQLKDLDIRMPIMSGLDALRAVRAKGVFPDVIVVSGYNSIDIVKEAIKEGVLDYVVKPLNPGELLSKIEQALVKKGKGFLKEED